MKPSTPPSTLPEGYADWLQQLEQDIGSARQRAALAVNAELVQLYGRIGQEILTRQQAQGWGARVIDRLARDLKDAFPDMRGWSTRNLKYTAFFAQHCPQGLIGQQPADQLPRLNFYLSAVDAQLKGGDDKPTIGLLLCKQQNRLVAEYALVRALSAAQQAAFLARLDRVRQQGQNVGWGVGDVFDHFWSEAGLAGAE